MSAALLIVAVIAAASLCPAMMWWNARRGRPGCLPSRAAENGNTGDLDSLRREQALLAAPIAELHSSNGGAGATAPRAR